MPLRRIVTGAILASSVAFVSGCAADFFGGAGFTSKSLVSSQAIEQIQKIPLPDGYKVYSTFGGESSLDHQDSTHGFHASSMWNGKSPAEACADFIKYGISLGATAWNRDQSPPFPLKGHAAQAQIQCVNTVNLVWTPEGTIDPNPDIATSEFVMRGTNTTTAAGTSISVRVVFLVGTSARWAEDAWTTLHIAVTAAEGHFTAPSWEAATAKMDPFSAESNAAVDAIGRYRAEHPDVDPMSVAALKQALANGSPSWNAIDVEIVPAKNGETYLQITPREQDNYSPRCVSLTPFDPKFFGTKDPGYGYGLGAEYWKYPYSDNQHNWYPRHQFASGTYKVCPTPKG